jgi:hypothetical protein
MSGISIIHSTLFIPYESFPIGSILPNIVSDLRIKIKNMSPQDLILRTMGLSNQLYIIRLLCLLWEDY